jgi:hypothetical protein
VSDTRRPDPLMFAVVVSVLAPLIYWALYTFPILQAIGGFFIYAGAVSWLICGDTSPLRSHRHG